MSKYLVLISLYHVAAVSALCRTGFAQSAHGCVVDRRREAVQPSTGCEFEESEPICADSGVTYDNKCLLDRDADRLRSLGLSVAMHYEGPCTETLVCNDMCMQDYAPVCASNLETYGSRCRMEAAACTSGGKLTILAERTCADYLGGGSIDEQLERLKQIGKRFDGDTVRTTTTCPEKCDDTIFAVVCGTDGRSYINECDLRMAACTKHFPRLAVWYDGICTEQDAGSPLYTDKDISEYISRNGDSFGSSQGVGTTVASNGSAPQGQALDDDSGSAVSVGLLIGVFIGLVMLTLVVAVCVTVVIKRQRKPAKGRPRKSKRTSMYENGGWSAGDVTDDMGKMPTGDVDVGV
ncbi:hypothetical protein SARC_08367 [Sphaeroforma arctica JP610]|uniref:Kazal-like domain-containing protein n=1 Tax=Sphaeroforma arctica JP610 TaxID=667725 RepID=A0A0L0FQZ7_9EUKA|nr:hypothetical protein SARC_08367 [Sphaeroforma arctica JP610]KNC79232.1 hypothetical protein SARC_08367 [Sphaeroforma arctica JP610]|eukprot:XP_014153134.1 hypothetical protein SARC_08367 [Sphaeroforma arctica JP610]